MFSVLWCSIWNLVTFRWKSVYLKNDALSVSNYLRKIEIPLSNIESVKASSWWGWQPRTITVRLKFPSEFGEKIVFVPRGGGFGADEAADELRHLFASHR